MQTDGLGRPGQVIGETREYLVEEFVDAVDCECLFYGLVASNCVDGIPAVDSGFLGHSAPDETHILSTSPCPCRHVRVQAVQDVGGQVHTADEPGQQVIGHGAVGFTPGLRAGEHTACDHPPEHLNDAEVPHQISDLPSGAAWHEVVEPTLYAKSDPVAVAAQGNDVIGRHHSDGIAASASQRICANARLRPTKPGCTDVVWVWGGS